MVVLGGLGSMKGSIAAALVLTALPELLRGFSRYRMLIYGILLVAMMITKAVDWSRYSWYDRMQQWIQRVVQAINRKKGGWKNGAA